MTLLKQMPLSKTAAGEPVRLGWGGGDGGTHQSCAWKLTRRVGTVSVLANAMSISFMST